MHIQLLACRLKEHKSLFHERAESVLNLENLLFFSPLLLYATSSLLIALFQSRSSFIPKPTFHLELSVHSGINNYKKIRPFQNEEVLLLGNCSRFQKEEECEFQVINEMSNY